MRPVSKGYVCFGVLLTLLLLGTNPSFALNPRFEIDLKALREKQPGKAPKQSDHSSQPPSDVRKGARPKEADTGKRSDGTVSRVNEGRDVPRQKSARPSGTLRKRGAASAGRTVRRSGKGTSSRARRQGEGASHRSVAALNSPGLSPVSAEARESVRWARRVWDRLVAAGGEEAQPMQLEGSNFSLSLDSERYPVFPAAAGGKIILDPERSLSPLVKAIIMEKEPTVRIVSENPADRRRFFNTLFEAARFYSIEEGFTVSFGTDPMVTVTSDFKIEKTAESLSNGDIFLVNVSGKRTGFPGSLLSYLENEGFHVVDFSPAPLAYPSDGRRTLLSIRDGNRETVADTLLEALSVNVEQNRNLELDDGSISGVTLTVRADRYYEGSGRKVVFSFADANPVQYTLLKLLELKGYKVVMLYPEDDFRKVSQKILSAFRVPATYGTHHLWNPRETSFAVQLSGFLLERGGGNDETIILTNVSMDPLLRDLVGLRGVNVVEK